MGTPGINLETTFRAVFKFQRIQQRADWATNRVIRRSAAITRTIMRRSIRKRKRNSSPGELPSSHVSSSAFGLRRILWHYDEATKSAIIGPVGGSENTGGPKALEFGGRSKIKLAPRARRKLGRKWTTGTIKARSFANPALQTFASEYPDLWKDAIV